MGCGSIDSGTAICIKVYELVPCCVGSAASRKLLEVLEAILGG